MARGRNKGALRQRAGRSEAIGESVAFAAALVGALASEKRSSSSQKNSGLAA